MTISFINEFEIDADCSSQIAALLKLCFPEADYNGRTFFKQLPHYRFLLKDDNQVWGQVAIDYRVMNLNGSMVRVFGIIDLVVHPDKQGRGCGTMLMKEVEKTAKAHSANIDFLFLVTDIPDFYQRLGYQKTNPTVTWLKINQGRNYGLTTEQVNDCFLMYKEVSGTKWANGTLDMLGYWY